MLKKEVALNKVKEILAKHHVKDFGIFKSKGYLIGEIDVFCEAAANILKKFPYEKWDQTDIAKNAKEVRGHAEEYVKGKNHVVVRVMGDLYFTWCSYKKNIYRPSIFQKELVKEKGCISSEEIYFRIEEVISYVTKIFNKSSNFDYSKIQISNPWSNNTRLKFFLGDGYSFCMVLNHHDLLHDSIERICYPALDYHSKYIRALEKYPLLNHEKIKSAIDNIVKKYDIDKYPFSIHYNSVINYGSYDQERIGIYVHGYTESGLFEDIELTVIYEHSLENLEALILKYIKSQISRHKKFGSPKSSWSEIGLDLVTYNYLKTIPKGIETLENYMKTGQNSLAQTGVRLRHTKKGLMGSFKIGDKVEWKGDRIFIHQVELSQTVLSSLKGRNISDLIEHEIIGSHAIMKSGKIKTKKKRSQIEVNLNPVMTMHKME